MVAPKSPVSGPKSADLLVGSVSVGGKLIVVVATATPGTLVHTVPASGLQYQRIVIWGTCAHTATVDLTIEWGATGSANQIITSLGAKRGMVEIIPDFKLAVGLSVYAFATVASVVRLYVAVGELTQGPSSRIAGGP